MRVRAGLIGGGMLALAALGYALAVLFATGASAHTDPCHPQHTCPSDHHSYIWTDPSTGLQWDCVEPGAREYDPLIDTTTIVWASRTYYCRAAGGTTISTSTTTATTTTLPTTATSLPTTATEPTSTATTTTTARALILPIASITPGALNPQVREGTIRRTICKAGWTAKVRPGSVYTTALKVKQMPLYEEGGSPSEYEEDHLIPLELGGAPRNPKNLWPEPRAQAAKSDPLETTLKRQVCRRQTTLARARTAIRSFKLTSG